LGLDTWKIEMIRTPSVVLLGIGACFVNSIDLLRFVAETQEDGDYSQKYCSFVII
jgi:hypothetical protein